MYNLHQLAEDLENTGTRVWLRDKHDNKVPITLRARAAAKSSCGPMPG